MRAGGSYGGHSINKLRSISNRSHEIIDGTYQRIPHSQIGCDAARQRENWCKGEAGAENRIDNRETLSTRAAYRIDAMDRRATTTGWSQPPTSRMFSFSQDARNYDRISSPITSKYYIPDVPARYVTPSQEHIGDSRFLAADYAYHAERGHTPQYYSSSESLASWRSVKPPYDNMMYRPSSGTHQSTNNPDYYLHGATNSAYHIGGISIPSSTPYKSSTLGGNTAAFSNGAGDAANHGYPHSSGRHYSTTYERASPRQLRRSANRENLRALPEHTG